MGIQVTYPFTTPGNYTFDANAIEVTGGKAQLKDWTPADSKFFATWNVDKDANWANGSKVGTLGNGATVAGGQLDLTGATKKYEDFDSVDNADLAQTGCIRFRFKANYNGGPGFSQFFFSISNGAFSNNGISIWQGSTGPMFIIMYEADGTAIFSSAQYGSLPCVSGQTYEVEVNFDLDDGWIWFYHDGVQVKEYNIPGRTRATTPTSLIRIGNAATLAYNANMWMEDFLVFSQPQHTRGVNYTPDWSGVKLTRYPATSDAESIYPTASIRCDNIEAMTLTADIDVRIQLEKDSQKYYWTGVAWAVSDGSYAQANPIGDLTGVVLGQFTSTVINLRIHLVYDGDGIVQLEADELTLTYDFAPPAITVNKCIVWGYNFDGEGNPDTDTFTIDLSYDAVEYDGQILAMKETITVTPNASTGYWEVELVETANMETGGYYIFTFGDKIFKKLVPNEASKNFHDLVDA